MKNVNIVNIKALNEISIENRTLICSIYPPIECKIDQKCWVDALGTPKIASSTSYFKQYISN